MKRLLKRKETGLVLIIILISVVITIKNSVFLRPDNLIDMVKGNTVLAITSLGMLLVIITGGIDVSVGAIIAAVTMTIGNFMLRFTGNVLAAFLVGCLAGVILGFVNGLLIALLKIPPIVATLGTVSVINGLMLYFTDGKLINNFPQSFIDFSNFTLFNVPDGQGGTIGVPVQLLFLIGMSALTWAILKYTVVGRGIFAMGGNAVSAGRLGFNILGITLFIYCYMGFVCGVAGVVHTSIMKQVDPNAFIGFEMQAIAAVILGGANVAGGSGTVSGTLLGVLLLAVIDNGLILMGIPTFWQKIITGAVIVFAVCFDALQKKRNEKNLVKVDVA